MSTPAKKDMERKVREALEILERSKSDGAMSAEGKGPVDTYFAVGFAKSTLRRALGLTDQPTGHA